MNRVGTVTSLQAHRAARLRRVPLVRHVPVEATLFFDLSSPYTYLAAERAERLFAGLAWQPARTAMPRRAAWHEEAARAVSERAAMLGLPLTWPEHHPLPVRGAMRVAALAAERGCGAAFVLAASRLAFCGGFDVDEPDILAEAAAAAGIGLREALAAGGDAGRDRAIEQAGSWLTAAGALHLPAIRVGGRLFCGEDRLLEAAAARAAV